MLRADATALPQGREQRAAQTSPGTQTPPATGNGLPTGVAPVVLQRLATVREAARLHRLAHDRRCLWLFYLEHNLFDEARGARRQMLELLRSACRQWRLMLGTAR